MGLEDDPSTTSASSQAHPLRKSYAENHLRSGSRAAYIYFAPISPGQVADTFVLTDALNPDVDETGKVLGLEILDAKTFFQDFATVFGGQLELPKRIDRETFDPGVLWTRGGV